MKAIKYSNKIEILFEDEPDYKAFLKLLEIAYEDRFHLPIKEEIKNDYFLLIIKGLLCDLGHTKFNINVSNAIKEKWGELYPIIFTEKR